MDVLRDLMEEIQRLQFLVFAYGQEEHGRCAVSLDPISGRLRITPEECGRVADALVESGMLEPVPDESGAEVRVRLTQKGREWIESLGSPLPHGPMYH
jgi:DNA-binding MarR family transcriptional regulator